MLAIRMQDAIVRNQKLNEDIAVSRAARLEIHQEELTFSAGHFTIFSRTEREQLHGHNYHISVAFNTEIGPEGLSFDYRHYKKMMAALCEELDGRFMLPANSPFLSLAQGDDYLYAHFNQQKIPFLREDIILLPISNTTLEELSHYFLQQLLKNEKDIKQHAISGITVKIYNGPGQSSASTWGKM